VPEIQNGQGARPQTIRSSQQSPHVSHAKSRAGHHHRSPSSSYPTAAIKEEAKEQEMNDLFQVER